MGLETTTGVAAFAAAKQGAWPAVGGWLFAKFSALSTLLPAGIGAGIMIAVDPPKTKKEMGLRALVAFAASFLFKGIAISWFGHTFDWFDAFNEDHRIAIVGIIGAVGWFIAGAASGVLKKFKKKPFDVIKQAKETVFTKN